MVQGFGNSYSSDERRRAAARARLNARLGIDEQEASNTAADDLAGQASRRRSSSTRSRTASPTRDSRTSATTHATRSAAETNTVSNVRGSSAVAGGGMLSGFAYVLGMLAKLLRSLLLRIPPVVLVCVALVFVLFIAITVLSNSCAATPAAEEPVAIEQAEETQEAQEQQPEQADFSLLPANLDSQVRTALEGKASDERVVRIVNHGEGLAALGETAQAKLLKLASRDDAALNYVADFSDKYPASAGEPYIETVTKGTVPDLKQWDERWGYVNYCAGPMGLNGCCPTSFAMVYMALTGKTDMTPADFAALATEDGFAVDNEGTVGDFLIYEAPALGLSCQWFYPSSTSLTWYLKNGFVCIINVGEGDFTDSGHFFVAYGVDSNGNILIRDPYSSVNTAKAWDPDVIANQSISMYAFAEL